MRHRMDNHNKPRPGLHKIVSLSDQMMETMERDNRMIQSFLQQKDVPSWFRGSSTFQMKAADELFNAIRDDTEQQTSHRVTACLTTIGLSPMVKSKQIKFLMHLSRGNDLAFLWFLMELHYKTPGPEYSLNEQLIMSMIAHLDIITTLRELDRILPPGNPPKKEIERMRKAEAARLKALAAPKRSRPKYIMPYFEALTRPKPYGKPLTIPMPDFKVTFDQYEAYKNPNYVVHNEANRWYAEYKLQTGLRITNNILNEEIGKIFDDFSKISLKTETIKTLCEHHKVVNELEKSLEQQLKVIARDRCLKHLDIDGRHKEERRKRITEQLDKDVAIYMCKFRKLTERARRESMSQLLSSDCCDPEECELGLSEGLATEEQSAETAEDVEEDSHEDKPSEPKPSVAREHRGMGDYAEASTTGGHSRGNTCPVGDGRGEASENQSQQGLKTRISIADEGKGGTRISEFSSKYMAEYDYGHYDEKSPTPSQTFFQAPDSHQPHHFDYRKIFRFRENTEETLNLKKAFVEALDSDVALLQRLQDEPPNVGASVDKCAKKIWKEQVAIKTAELEAEEECIRNLPMGGKTTPLNYDQDYYDPEDKELMHSMLRDALEYMTQNTKFVLASMPEAWKLPILREWVYSRYGKLYTKADRYRSFRLSLKIFMALDKVSLRVPMPHQKQLGTELFVDYSCRDYLIKKANYIKKQYYNRLNDAIMSQARVFWFAMRPYLCSNGPPRNTYFAYMPSRVLGITRFRLWKPTEFMNAKREWERRMMNKKPI